MFTTLPTCVVVADSAHALLYSVLPAAHSRRVDRPLRASLHEEVCLVYPEARTPERTAYAGNRPSLVHSGLGHTPFSGGDHHRNGHREEDGRRFAYEVVDAAMTATHDNPTGPVLLVAGPPMLGLLRWEIAARGPQDLRFIEIPHNLSSLPVDQLHDRLADEGVIPARG